MKKLVVVGSQGQVARALRKINPDAVFLDRSVIDLSYPDNIPAILEKYDPYAVINAAAYTQVDNAEREENLAFIVNADAPASMAFFCVSRDIPFINFSSDYVFDGSGNNAWKETDATNPLNAYGRSKLGSEEGIAQIGGKYLILRTSWVYDSEGKNFLNTILKLAGERDELRVINNQFGAPTYAMHLAEATLSVLKIALTKSQFPSGIYHACNSGVTTWHGFASGIVEEAKKYDKEIKVKNIYPIPATEYPLPAQRPYNSRLDCSKMKTIFNISLPDWQKGLEDCMRVKNENH